jgi:hypothetical protein
MAKIIENIEHKTVQYCTAYTEGNSYLEIILKVCGMMQQFLLILFLYITYIHTITLIQYIKSVVIHRGFSPSPHRWSAQWDKPPWGAGPRIELGPAYPQADALPTELLRTLTELRSTLTELRW